jgi:DNA-binding transcriptional ArsR family regulator
MEASSMSYSASFSFTASLIADPARAAILMTLLDGRALPAGELAYASNVTPQTASSHLAKLLAGGLLAVETEGRHRYYRLAGSHVAQALEQLAAIRSPAPVRRRALSPQARELRFCRCCYDHLADKQFEVTPVGAEWFATIGLDVDALKPTRRGLARQCLDWTERTHHLAGPLGIGLLRVMCANGWLRRAKHSRAVRVLPKGWRELKRHLDVDTVSIATPHTS